MERIYIYGAGKNGKQLLSILRRVDIAVEAFIDRDRRKQGMAYGIQCLSIDEIAKDAEACVVLISVYESAGIEETLKSYHFKAVYDLGKILTKLHCFFPLTEIEEDYKSVAPFNQYDSPYPDIIEIHGNESRMFGNKKIDEIDFNLNRQMELLGVFDASTLLDWTPYPSDKFRYYYGNEYFMAGCAHVLFYMINVLKPKKIIEVGSGFSTAVMLDTNENCFDNKIEVTAIEPYPGRLKKILRPDDVLEICEKKLQDIPVDYFECLGENDILFIDSSHVSKFNSDVNYIFFEILPRLKKGVYIHFHDIFYPFIYPKQWIYEGRAYNEMYLLRAFLMDNQNYKIQLFPDMLIKENYKGARELLDGNVNNSIYLRKE